MKIYTLHTKQNLPISKEEAWKFLSDPKNLKTITPDYMGFKTLSGDDREMFAGQIIQYIVTPVFGIPMKWVTEITHVVDNQYFVDEQRFGPYTMWHHKHSLREVEGGVEMIDVVHYKIPLGFIGDIMNQVYIKSQLKKIFNYRFNSLNKIIGEIPNQKPFLEFASV